MFANEECCDCCAAASFSLSVLSECDDFLRGLTGAEYVRASEFLAGSTIGQHVRHCLDHFGAIEAALDGAMIDYDHRARDTPEERDLGRALERLERIRSRIGVCDAARGVQMVRVRMMLSGDGSEVVVSSTLERELAFAAHHAVHHHAMMASIAKEWGHVVPEGFGRAPSTRHYERGAAKKSGDAAA